MADVHDYLEDQLRDVETDLKRALKRLETMDRGINPVTPFGSSLKLEVFSLGQSLGEVVRRLGETRDSIRENRKSRGRNS